ncbi:MAG: multidrug DMT transporter permease [Ignavibacteriales bacterium]|nr:MAG: multidrug DMT transporter permease [Ignavibacteriales bacterium]
MIKQNIKAYIAWLNICIIWGTTYLAIRIGVDGLPPMLFAGVRWLAAGFILFSFLKLKGYKTPDRNEFFHNTVIGVLLLGFGNGLVVVSEQWIESGLTALLITTVPFWIVGFESLLPGKTKMNYLVISGLVLGLGGVILIFGSNLKYIFLPNHLLGIFTLTGAVAIWAAGTLYSKYKKMNIHPLMSASVQMIVAGILQTLLGIIIGEAGKVHITQSNLFAFLYLITFGSLVGYTSYIYAVSHLPVSLVSTYAYINPVIALFLGWLILGEALSLTIVLASIIILAGVYVVKLGTDKYKREILKTNN